MAHQLSWYREAFLCRRSIHIPITYSSAHPPTIRQLCLLTADRAEADVYTGKSNTVMEICIVLHDAFVIAGQL